MRQSAKLTNAGSIPVSNSMGKQKEYQARWYRNHKEEQCARVRAAKRKIVAYAVAAKDTPCTDCGKRYPPWVMDFDHVRGPKLFDIGSARNKAGSLRRLKEEIAKCEVVCANCHRTRTHDRLCLVGEMAITADS